MASIFSGEFNGINILSLNSTNRRQTALKELKIAKNCQNCIFWTTVAVNLNFWRCHKLSTSTNLEQTCNNHHLPWILTNLLKMGKKWPKIAKFEPSPIWLKFGTNVPNIQNSKKFRKFKLYLLIFVNIALFYVFF